LLRATASKALRAFSGGKRRGIANLSLEKLMISYERHAPRARHSSVVSGGNKPMAGAIGAKLGDYKII
jgi:hypothetical protein